MGLVGLAFCSGVWGQPGGRRLRGEGGALGQTMWVGVGMRLVRERAWEYSSHCGKDKLHGNRRSSHQLGDRRQGRGDEEKQENG